MREEDHLNFLTTGCQKNKTKQQVKKRPTKTVLDGKESGDTSFATLTKVAAGSGKRKQQDGKVTVSLAPGSEAHWPNKGC